MQKKIINSIIKDETIQPGSYRGRKVQSQKIIQLLMEMLML